MEKRDAVLTGGVPFFDSKPLIMKAWDANMDMEKENFDVLPTWVQSKVDFKYWGDQCLRKLVAPIGKFMRVDKATELREKLQYARILIEVKVDHDFPDQLSFVNEKGIEVVFEIHYEWKPVICDVCHHLGHSRRKVKGQKCSKGGYQKLRG